MKTKRIDLKKMGIRGGTEIVAIIVKDEKLQVAIDYGKGTTLKTRAFLVTALFRDVVADIAASNPGHEKEIFDMVRGLVVAELDRQQKGLDR